MLSQAAPGWLVPAFARAALSAGATAEPSEIDDAARRLLARWQEPGREFHNVRHLVDLLQRVDELKEETHNAGVVRLAAWYHGAVFSSDEDAAYARRGGEDEVASAQVARDELSALGVPQPAVDEVAMMVEMLARHSAPPTSDCSVLRDADLAVLASDPQRYKQYVAEVRAEYAHIPEDRFLEARRTILRKLLGRERLYSSPQCSSWEAQARQNVQAELTRIDRALANQS